jgi:hypothetical protein
MELALAYQLVVDVLLVTILTLESMLEHFDWLGDDAAKEVFKVGKDCLLVYDPSMSQEPPSKPSGWWDWTLLSFGCLGLLAAVEAEFLIPDIAD